MPYKIQYYLLFIKVTYFDFMLNLICQFLAHDIDVAIGICLISARHYDLSQRQSLFDSSLNHSHIIGGSLESMA
jgi:hypothetical protein